MNPRWLLARLCAQTDEHSDWTALAVAMLFLLEKELPLVTGRTRADIERGRHLLLTALWVFSRPQGELERERYRDLVGGFALALGEVSGAEEIAGLCAAVATWAHPPASIPPDVPRKPPEPVSIARLPLGRRGQAAIEFALVLPVLVAMVALMLGAGIAMWRTVLTTESVAAAASAGAAQAVAAVANGATSCGAPGLHCTSHTCTPAAQFSPWSNIESGCAVAEVTASPAFATSITLSGAMGEPAGLPAIAGAFYSVTAQRAETISSILGPLQVASRATAVVWQAGGSAGVVLVPR